MAFSTLASSVRWTNENPAIYLKFEYDRRRSGADMEYRLRVTVSTVSGQSWYGYPIVLAASIAGVSRLSGISLKAASPSQWTSEIVYDSTWFTVANKASGTTAVSFTITSGSGSSRSGTYNYNMAVDAGKATLTVGNGTLGTQQTLTVNGQGSGLTYTITYVCGSLSGTIVTATSSTNIGWTPPLSLAAANTTGTSVSVKLTLATYASGSLVGSNSYTITCAIPASVKPSCSMTLEDTTGIDDIYGSPVQGLSKIKVTVSATTAYGSSIESYRIVANGVTYSGSTATTAELQKSGTSTVTVTVTDKRGRSGTATYNMTVQAYQAPSVSKLQVRRCNQDGTLNDRGQYVRVDFSATVQNLGNNNTASYKLRYKKSTVETFTTVNFSELADQFTVTDKRYIFQADDGSSYNVEVEVQDKHRTTVATTRASTGFTLIHYGSDGKSIAFGKLSEKSGFMEVALDAELTGTTIQKGNSFCFSSGGTAGSTGYVQIATITVLRAAADNPIVFELVRRRVNGPMKVQFRFTATDNTTPEVQSITYEGENYGAFLCPLSASSWGLYVQKGLGNDIITVQRWYTSDRMLEPANPRIAVVFTGSFADTLPDPFYRATPAKLRSLLDFIYPVGSIYLAYNHTDPGTIFGGTWERINNRFLWACDADGTIGSMGGSATHTLTINEMPKHGHGSVYTQHVDGEKNLAWYTVAGNSIGYDAVFVGGGQAHNNMPPYIHIAAWRRTA